MKNIYKIIVLIFLHFCYLIRDKIKNLKLILFQVFIYKTINYKFVLNSTHKVSIIQEINQL